MKRTVNIKEILERQITVEVESDNIDEANIEAINMVKEMYNNSEIVLDSSDYVDTEYKIMDWD